MKIVHRRLYLDFSKQKSFRIIPHADLQLGHPDVDLSLLKRDIEEASNDPYCVTLGLGDLIDSDRPSARIIRTSAYAGREDALRQEDEKKQAWIDKKVIPLLLPLTQSPNTKQGFGLLGELDGHHHEQYQDGTTSTQYIISRLKELNPEATCSYLGEMSCYVILHVHDIKDTSHTFTLVVHAQHGTNTGSFIGSDLSNLEKKSSAYFEADIFLRGHSTKKYAVPKTLLYPSRKETAPYLMQKTIILANTGGYMKGYGNSEKASYVERAGLMPVALGHIIVEVFIRKDKAHNSSVYPELRAIT